MFISGDLKYDFQTIRMLDELNLSNNSITSLNPTITKLEYIRSLNLSSNQLRKGSYFSMTARYKKSDILFSQYVKHTILFDFLSKNLDFSSLYPLSKTLQALNVSENPWKLNLPISQTQGSFE